MNSANLLKVEAFAKRCLGNDEKKEEKDSDIDAKDKVERLEKTNQGITAIKSIMYPSHGLYEEVEDMITKMVGIKAKKMLESEKEIDLSKVNASCERLKYRQTWKELIHHEIYRGSS